MADGPGDEPRQNAEPTFADVMNGFSFDSGRPRKKRRWGRRREDEGVEDGPRTPSGGSPQASYPPQAQQPPERRPEAYETGPIDRVLYEPVPPSAPIGASAVRPYAWTRGRTKSGFELAIETLVSTSPQGRAKLGMLQMEHRSVADICDEPRSVAEVAALLSIPLGVARVLLGDMAGLGVVTVHQTVSSAGNLPDLALMERVLSGLRRL
ncbi:MAG: DUF742 domain-containing protein [Pseudonocardia sp.]|nr:DUF742 domain-containing protein [Pseudonocardia sp.]